MPHPNQLPAKQDQSVGGLYGVVLFEPELYGDTKFINDRPADVQ